MAQKIEAKPENIHLVLEPALWGGCLLKVGSRGSPRHPTFTGKETLSGSQQSGLW